MEKEVKAAEANYDKAAEAAQEIDSQVTRQRSRIHDNSYVWLYKYIHVLYLFIFVQVKTCDAKIKEITGSKIKSVQVIMSMISSIEHKIRHISHT